MLKMDDIQTMTLSTNSDQIFLQDLNNHISAPNVDPPNDFKYVKIIYHDTKNRNKHLSFE